LIEERNKEKEKIEKIRINEKRKKKKYFKS